MYLSLPALFSKLSAFFSLSPFAQSALQLSEPAISFHISFPIFFAVRSLSLSLLGYSGSPDLQGCQNIRNHLRKLSVTLPCSRSATTGAVERDQVLYFAVLPLSQMQQRAEGAHWL